MDRDAAFVSGVALLAFYPKWHRPNRRRCGHRRLLLAKVRQKSLCQGKRGKYLLFSDGFKYDGTKWTSIDYPGDNDTYATGIYGDHIVGHYDDGDRHGFLAVPDPTTSSLLL